MRMKTTNTWEISQRLSGLEYNLLKRAVVALGGSVSFVNDDEDESEMPIVPANPRNDNCPCDFYITRLEVNKGGLSIYGYRNDEYSSIDDEVEIWPGDIYAGWINYIFDYLPEVDGFNAFATKEELEALIKDIA